MFFKKKKSNLLALTITQSHITLTNKKNSRIISSHGIISDELHILNMSKFIHLIGSFKQNTPNTQAIIALESPSLAEQLTSAEVEPPRELQNLVWHSLPLSQQTNSLLYTCGISRELIFQYELLCNLSKIKLINLTTITMTKIMRHKKALSCGEIEQLKNELAHIDNEFAALQIGDEL